MQKLKKYKNENWPVVTPHDVHWPKKIEAPQKKKTHKLQNCPKKSQTTEKMVFFKKWPSEIFYTSQELRMLSSVTINCQITKIVKNLGSQLESVSQMSHSDQMSWVSRIAPQGCSQKEVGM